MFSLSTVIDKTGQEHHIPPTAAQMKACADGFRTYTGGYGFARPDRSRYGINVVVPEDLENEAVQAQMKAAGDKAVVYDYRKMLADED
jgi:hypothetical protein